MHLKGDPLLAGPPYMEVVDTRLGVQLSKPRIEIQQPCGFAVTDELMRRAR